jgi:hypothetical protein
MGDKPELLHLPEKGNSSLVRSPARSDIVARGLKDAEALTARRAEVVCRAIVSIRKGESRRVGNATLPPPRLYGVIDRNGHYVVDPIFKGIQPFSEGLTACSEPLEARVYASSIETLFNADLGLWRYFDHNGQTVIGPRFERARGFSEGLAAAAIEGKWGFIRKDGSWAIRPQFDGALSFENGLACVRVDQKCGFVDRSGNIAIGPRFDLAFAFSEGLACVELAGKVGYIGKNGDFAIEPRFNPFDKGSLYGATSFQSGVARVALEGRACLIGQAGNLIFQCIDEGETIGDFNEGVAIVHEQGGNWDHGYYIDSMGQKILSKSDDDSSELDDAALDAVEGFAEGLGVVAASFALWHHGELLPLWKYAEREGSRRLFGYLDRLGRLAIFPQFASAKPFKEGLAAVDVDGSGKYGFIIKSGELSIETQFAKVGYFSNGVARVGQRSGFEGKWGFIDRSGNISIACQYDWAEDFQEIAI